jgi:hypothetical protein
MKEVRLKLDFLIGDTVYLKAASPSQGGPEMKGVIVQVVIHYSGTPEYIVRWGDFVSSQHIPDELSTEPEL